MLTIKNLKVYTILFALLFCSVKAGAQNYERLSEYEQNLYGVTAHVNADYETMRNVRSYWVKECNKLKNRNCEFVLCGNAEAVLRVTIPARVLYNQGETELSQQADGVLRPLLKFVNGPDAIASCIVACHSDNNGSEKYLTNITKARAESLSKWFVKQGVDEKTLSHYGHANRVLRANNENIKNRELNRRVTIYLVPNKKMLKLAKKGKL